MEYNCVSLPSHTVHSILVDRRNHEAHRGHDGLVARAVEDLPLERRRVVEQSTLIALVDCDLQTSGQRWNLVRPLVVSWLNKSIGNILDGLWMFRQVNIDMGNANLSLLEVADGLDGQLSLDGGGGVARLQLDDGASSLVQAAHVVLDLIQLLLLLLLKTQQ